MVWKIRKQELSLDRPLLMGILNVTPDSFSDGGQFFDCDKAVKRALELAAEGADIIDMGGESTRPGAQAVSAEEELKRVLPVLEAVRAKVSIPISIDTTKPEVAEACLKAGADIINEVSGLRESGRKMGEVVAAFKAGLILMHRRGNSETMQSLAKYHDVVGEIIAELCSSVRIALGCGIDSEQMVVDPGLGFSKTTEHNLEILRRLDEFHGLGLPVLLGPSRKSFLGEITGSKEPGEREFSTAAVVTIGIMKGSHIFRVHNVKAMKDVIQTTQKICGDRYVRTFEMGEH